jgi:hypothetical protein
MRHIEIVGLILTVLVGCSTQTAQRLPDDAIGTLTQKETITKTGAPSYERQCDEGSMTLGWKQWVPPSSKMPEPGRLLVVRSLADPNEVLVCKFDEDGKLLWWREVR